MSGGDLIVTILGKKKTSVILSVVTDDCVKSSKYVYIFYYIIAVVLCRSILYRKIEVSLGFVKSSSCIER